MQDGIDNYLREYVNNIITQLPVSNNIAQLPGLAQGDHHERNVIRRCRDRVSKPALDEDDIITTFTYADEHNIPLPPFVKHSPHSPMKMPSIRLVEGDLKIPWSKF